MHSKLVYISERYTVISVLPGINLVASVKSYDLNIRVKKMLKLTNWYDLWKKGTLLILFSFIIQVTWSDLSVTCVTKTHQELQEFLLKVRIEIQK